MSKKNKTGKKVFGWMRPRTKLMLGITGMSAATSVALTILDSDCGDCDVCLAEAGEIVEDAADAVAEAVAE